MEDAGFNGHKTLRGQGPTSRRQALIRCGAASADGGSVARMLTLARALRGHQNMAVGFSLRDRTYDLFPIRGAGFAAQQGCGPEEFAISVTSRKPDLLILDGGLSGPQIEALRRDVTVIAAIEDRSDARLACDFAYYAPLPQAKALGWTGARTVPRLGWEWALLGLDPRHAPARPPGSRPTLLISVGDSDPTGLTERIARLLAPLDSAFRIRFIIGRGMQNAGKTAAAIVAMNGSYETVEGADDLSTEYASADIALCAFGGGAFELAAFGVPAVYLALTDEEARSASVFAAAGMGETLGVADLAADAAIRDGVLMLMNNATRRREMRACGLAALDGAGAARIAADLAQALREETAPVRARQ